MATILGNKDNIDAVAMHENVSIPKFMRVPFSAPRHKPGHAHFVPKSRYRMYIFLEATLARKAKDSNC